MGKENECGTVEIGMRADLLLLVPTLSALPESETLRGVSAEEASLDRAALPRAGFQSR